MDRGSDVTLGFQNVWIFFKAPIFLPLPQHFITSLVFFLPRSSTRCLFEQYTHFSPPRVNPKPVPYFPPLVFIWPRKTMCKRENMQRLVQPTIRLYSSGGSPAATPHSAIPVPGDEWMHGVYVPQRKQPFATDCLSLESYLLPSF